MNLPLLVNYSSRSHIFKNLRNLCCTWSTAPSKSDYSVYCIRNGQFHDDYSNNNGLLASTLITSCKFYTTSVKNGADPNKHVIAAGVKEKLKSETDINEKLDTSEIPGKTRNKTTTVSSGTEEKLGLFKRFKLMYKQYWYVLIPVHVVTSIGWFGGFYYLSKSGVDVPSLLQSLHISDALIEKVRGSMGHVAIAYLLYKIATPVRYAVTLGGTTFCINHLSQLGYIKPVPSKDQFKKMLEDKKADMVKKKQERQDRKADQSS